jgi:hypothetical protein
LNSAGALAVFNQEFATISNKISNANTPGFADQNLALVAQPFDPAAAGKRSRSQTLLDILPLATSS